MRIRLEFKIQDMWIGTAKEKSEIALALLLLRDYRCNGKHDCKITRKILKLSNLLSVEKEFQDLYSTIPPFFIIPKHKMKGAEAEKEAE